jgi:hypothetical protein
MTLDAGTTNITLGSTVNPATAVTDALGNADATPGSGPIVTVELIPLSLNATPVSVVRGQEVLVAVDVGEVDGLKTATYDVSFDTPVLRLDSVTAGTIGGTPIPVISSVITSSGGISNATITQDVTAGATGTGILANLRFTFIGNSGESSGISLSNVDLRNLGSVLIPVTLSNTGVSSPLVVGDASGDGKLNVLDVTVVELIVAQIRPPTPGADANGCGGEINAVDITGVERLVLGLPVGTSGTGNAQVEEPPEVLVTIEAPAEVQQDEVFTARLSIDGIEKFDSANFDHIFDPNVLTIDNINPGTGITGGDLAGRSIPIVETNQSEPGVVRVVINVPGFPGLSGTGYLAEVQFRPIGAPGDTSTIDLADLVLSDNTAREILSASQSTAVTLRGNRPPVAHAGFELLKVDKSTTTFRIQASAEDPDGNLERVEAVIETPSLDGLKISLREDDRFHVKFDLRKNKLEIKGPNPQDILDQLQNLSGLLVTDNQNIKIKLTNDPNKVEFKIGKDGTLEVTANQVTLRVIAIDAQGESDTATANPVFPAKQEPKKGKGRR